MKNIHIIQTDKPSRLHKIGNELGLTDTPNSNFLAKQQNIYITSDEEIKEGDNSFYPPFGVGKNIVIDGELCFHIEAKDGKGSFTQRTYQTLDRNKKIILTTDQDLIKDGVQPIPDEFLEWFVKNQSCEWVEVLKYKSNNMHKMNLGYKPIIPKEEQKQETLEEAVKNYCIKKYSVWVSNSDKSDDFINGAKWQQEQDKNKYSEEDLEVAFFEGQFGKYSFNDWLEQFKKK